MMRTCLLVLALLPCLAAAPPATQEADRPVSLAEAKARGSLQSLAELAGLPVIDVPTIDKVLKLSLKDNDLAFDTSIAPTDQSLVRIAGFPGVSHVRRSGSNHPDSTSPLHFHFENRDFTVPSAICRYTTVSVAGGTLTLWQALETLDDRTHSIQLLQHTVPMSEDSPRISLYIQVEGEENLTATADNIVELRRKNPGAFTKYIDPIFQTLRQEPPLSRVNARLAWQVFPSAFEATPSLTEQVNMVVRELDAPKFRDREAASARLEALGQPAALLLMRTPRDGLSDEQVSRLDAFIAKYKLVSDEEAAKLRGNRDFLLDCLAAPEAPLRAAALQELRRMTGKQIEFDVNADPATRSGALARLRATLPATTRSAPE